MSKYKWKVGDLYSETVAAAPKDYRMETLGSLAYHTKTSSYSRNLTPEELVEKKSRLSELALELEALEEKKKQLMDEIKTEMAEPKSEYSEVLSQIKYKQEQKSGKLFEIDDQEEGRMYVFDSDAICIEVRSLRPEERQGKMRMLNTGTNEG